MVFFMAAQAQSVKMNPKTDNALLTRFQDAKLGLFVHWMACHTPTTGDSWSIGRGTPKTVADSITMSWNPEKFDARRIVDVAVQSGCRYMVVISKHHDGFCIWPSAYSDFDLDRGAFHRDMLKELGNECRKRGLLFGIYYSIADIDYCGWTRMPGAGEPVPEPRKGKADFVSFVHNQTRELIQRYQPNILWFDGFWLDPLWSAREGRHLYQVIKSAKSDVLSTRLSVTKDSTGQETFWTDGASGDYFSMEAKTTDAPDFPWEACTSVTYPVYAYEPDAKMLSGKALIDLFSRTLCGNGNLLVNIGPKPTGEVPEEQVARLHELTDRIEAHQDAVYGTRGGPYRQTDQLGSTYRGKNLYLHIRDPHIQHVELTLPEACRVKSATVLDTGARVEVRQRGDGRISLVCSFPEDAQIPVIALKLNRKFRFDGWLESTAS